MKLIHRVLFATFMVHLTLLTAFCVYLFRLEIRSVERGICLIAESIVTDSVIFQRTCVKLPYFYFLSENWRPGRSRWSTYVTVPNFVVIGQTLRRYGDFSIFQRETETSFLIIILSRWINSRDFQKSVVTVQRYTGPFCYYFNNTDRQTFHRRTCRPINKLATPRRIGGLPLCLLRQCVLVAED